MEEKGTMIIEEFTKRSIISNAAFPSSAHSGYRYLNRSINPVKKHNQFNSTHTNSFNYLKWKYFLMMGGGEVK